MSFSFWPKFNFVFSPTFYVFCEYQKGHFNMQCILLANKMALLLFFFPEYRPKEAFIKKEALIKMYT